MSLDSRELHCGTRGCSEMRQGSSFYATRPRDSAMMPMRPFRILLLLLTTQQSILKGCFPVAATGSDM
jgi:hypothetical protein